MNTVGIDLDVSKASGTPQVVTIGQGDHGGTTIEASVYDGGEPIDLADMTAIFEARLPDGRTYARDINCECEGNVITYKVDEEHVGAIAGITDDAYFDILDGSEVVYSTNRFRLEILRSAHDGAVPAENWDNAVDALIDRGDAALDAYDRAESSRKSAETSRVSAESARKTAETQRVSAESARSSAESARVSSESQRASAETQRASAESARKTAESSRATAESARASAESARKTAETQRASAQSANDAAQQQNDLDQLKNNSDQALNNQAAQGIISVVLASGQYDTTTRKPTITGEIGKIYLVPKTDATTSDHYLEWMWLNGAWEQIGTTETTIEGITTDEIDAVVDDEAPTGSHILSLTGLSYLWAKVKDYLSSTFAAITHKHSAGDITSGTLSVARGGTGKTNAADARTALGAASQADLGTIQTQEEYDRQVAAGVYDGRDLISILGASSADDCFAKLHQRAVAKNAAGIRIGDYIDVTPTVSTVNRGAAMRYRVAGIAHNLGFGDTACPWAFWMVPDNPVDMTGSEYAINTSYIYWNTTNDNNGTADEKRPYLCSNLHQWELEEFLPALPTALQNVLINHRILFEERYSASGKLNESSGWSLGDAGKVFSLSEMEVYGCCVWGTKGFSVGEAAQLPLFKDSRYRIKSRVSWWLRSVGSGSSSYVCYVSYYGHANYTSATNIWVRPRPCFLIG